MVDYKNVALSNNSESEDEFVNIVVPLFEDADSEMAKSAVREMLSTSIELGQKAEKKQKLKQGLLFYRLETDKPNQERTTALYSCHSVFMDWFIFRFNFPRMRLPLEPDDQSQETNLSFSHHRTETAFVFCGKGILNIQGKVTFIQTLAV